MSNALPRTPSFRLEGKKALVTGASRGIGLGCAMALAEAGAHVVCAARGKDQLEASVEAINGEGLSAESLQMDVADLDQLTEFFTHNGALDVVVNSAGIARHGPALDSDPSDFQSVMDINVRGAYYLSVGAAKNFIANNKPGSIVHISSQMGHVGGIDRSVYCASKHAVEGMTKAMAIEWGPHNIRINTICPTFIKTPLTQPTFDNPERVAWIKSKIKLDRIGEIEDIMGATVFLASDASSMVTGTSMLIDGGWTAG